MKAFYVLLLSLYLIPTSADILFEDDFSSNNIDTSKWSLSMAIGNGWNDEQGDFVSVSNGIVTIAQNKTDKGGTLRSTAIKIQPDQPLKLTRRIKINPNDYFRNSNYLVDENNNFIAGYRYFYDYRTEPNGVYFVYQGSDYFDLSWGVWITEEFIFNPKTGEASYSDGNSMMNYTFSAYTGDNLYLIFDAYGWGTGHKVEIDYVRFEQGNFNSSIPTTEPASSPTPIVEITDSSGDIIIATTSNVDVSSENNQLSDAVAIVTPAQTETTIVINDASVKVKADTVLLTHPEGTDTSPVANPPVSTLIRGEVQSQINCTSSKDFLLHTVLADVSTICNAQRAPNSVEFTTSYKQDGLNGTLTVSVLTGSVTVTDRNNQTFTVSAGSSKTFQQIVSRSSWVLPIDNDKVYGGQDNLFVWTAYPGAAGYILEYNVAPQAFSEENVETVEFQIQTVKFLPGDYTIFDDMVLLNLFIGESVSKIQAQGRIFAINANGNIIAETTSSDKVSVDWE